MLASRKWLLRISASATAVAFAPGIASAQTAVPEEEPAPSPPAIAAADLPAQVSGEIVVTARKRAESIVDVPISISAFSSEDIQEGALFDIVDIARQSPGLAFQPGSGLQNGRQTGQIIFRGLNATYGQAREQSGSLFVDGIYIQSGSASSINTSDVERVEVLKGPQNAYFGRNTFGGAINFITRNPGDRTQGLVEASAGSRGSYNLNASLEGPLLPGVIAARLSTNFYGKGGQYTARDGGELGEQSSRSVSGTLYVTPSEPMWLRLKAHYQQDDDGPSTTVALRATQYGSLCPGQTFPGRTATGEETRFALSLPYFCGDVPTADELQGFQVSSNTSLIPSNLVSIGRPNLFRDLLISNSMNNPLLAKTPVLRHLGFRRDLIRLSAQAAYAFANEMSLNLNFGFNDSKSTQAYDSDLTDQENTLVIRPALDRDYSAEARLQSGPAGRLRWLAGASYFKSRSRGDQFGYQIGIFAGSPLPTTGFVGTRSDDRAEVMAGFASVDFDLTSQLTLTGEIRYQSDKATVLSTTGTTSITYKNWLPRIIARFEPTPNSSLYASWSRGVQQGQLNGGYALASPTQRAEIDALFPGASELSPQPTLDNYEIGFKQRTLGGRLYYAVSAYYMKWNDINTAVNVLVTGATPGTVTALSIIAPNNATLYGVEAEMDWRVTREFTLAATLNVQKNVYDDFFNPTLGSLTSQVTRFGGNRLPKSPSVTGSMNATYRRAISANWEAFVRGEIFYVGKQWDSEANIAQLNDYARVNLRLGLERDGLSLEVFAKNLFDDRNWNSGSRSTSLGEPGSLLFVPFNGRNTTVPALFVQPADPREIGVRARFEF